jgi:hypothetical protein
LELIKSPNDYENHFRQHRDTSVGLKKFPIGETFLIETGNFFSATKRWIEREKKKRDWLSELFISEEDLARG